MEISILELVGVGVVALVLGKFGPNLLDWINGEERVKMDKELAKTVKESGKKIEDEVKKAEEERRKIDEEIANESAQNIVNRFYDVFSKRPSHKPRKPSKPSRGR